MSLDTVSEFDKLLKSSELLFALGKQSQTRGAAAVQLTWPIAPKSTVGTGAHFASLTFAR
jgi:hypothetical protein